VGAAGNYVIETQGTTDVVMGLYGPNDMATLSVENDDGEVQGNSRISPNLSLGTYYVRVRHYSSTSAGNYSIAVQQSAAQPDIPIIQVNGPPS
jgi:tyrosinase